MTHSAQLERIRQFVQHTFERLDSASSCSVRESVLVRDGQYCGRRFLTDTLQAVWFVEENELKFYGEDGSLLRVAVADAVSDQTHRAAA
jgi:hypothetical protein